MQRVCSQPGCTLLIPKGERFRSGCERCAKRAAECKPWANKRERLPFMSTARWQKKRLSILERDPICKVCDNALSEEVDHIIAATLDRPELWFDDDNLQGICVPCHREKTARASAAARKG